MLLFLKIDWRYFFLLLNFMNPAFSSFIFFTITHIKRFLASDIALISSFWLSLMTSLWKLSLGLFLILEKRCTRRIYGFVCLDFLWDIALYIALFLFLFFCLIYQLFLNQIFLFRCWFELTFLFKNSRMKAMFHPPMAFIAIHASWTFWGLNRLYFILKVPMRTFFRFILIDRRLSSKILNIMGIWTFRAVMTW